MFKAFFVFLLASSSVVLSTELGPIIETSSGRVQGSIKKNIKGKTFHAFEGIPYAVPPIGENRFTIPRDPDWKGVLEATNNEHECLQQNDLFLPTGSEDCLYLNIYSPANLSKNENHALPVLFWIHQGGFNYKSKQVYKPNYFMDFDIILVTINYRLGALGFLSTLDGVIPSNLGLKDQRHALRWVSKNIQKFGGDPNKITAAGQSAGAISISYMLLDEKTEGLFRGAILESGSALCLHDFQPDPKSNAFLLGNLIDSNFKNNSKDLLKLLKQLSSDELLTYSLSPNLTLNNNEGLFQLTKLANVWEPVVENSMDTDIVIPIPMHQAFIEDKFFKIPMIVGFTSEESSSIIRHEITPESLNNVDANPGFLIDGRLNIKNKREAGEKIKSLYSTNFTKNPDAAVKFFSDNYYTTPILRQADLIREHSSVYLYQFSYQDSTKANLPEAVGHSSELKYLFGEDEFPNEQDRLTHERLMKMWTNFIKFQHPTPEDDETLIKWPATTSELIYLDINQTLSILKHPKKYEGWKPILSEYMTEPLWIY